MKNSVVIFYYYLLNYCYWLNNFIIAIVFVYYSSTIQMEVQKLWRESIYYERKREEKRVNCK